jgi:DNA-directed RNA polymerase subunit M/transcription elongation factor TFIIS
MTYSTIRITTKGDVSRAVPVRDKDTLDMADAQAYFGKKQEPAIIGHYNYKDKIVYIIGYNKGKTGTENKYALPKPYDKVVLFGEFLLVASSNKKVATTTIRDLVPLVKDDFDGLIEAASGQGAATEAEVPDEPLDEDEEELPEFEEEEEEEDEDEDVNAASDDDIAEVEIEVEPEPEEKPKRKKKVITTQILSGFQKQSLLIVSENGNELTADSSAQTPERQACKARFEFLGDKSAVALEHEIFVATLGEALAKHIFANWKNSLFREIHNYKQFKLFSNLHPDSPVKNPRLLQRVREGELSMADLARLDDMELYPENWKKLQDQQLVREQKLLEGKAAASTDMFKCGRCGKRETTYYEMQTRSADEPMTIFITCCNCGKKWKQ